MGLGGPGRFLSAITSKPESFRLSVSLPTSSLPRYHDTPSPKDQHLMQPQCDCDERLKPLQTNVRCAARRGGLTVWPLRSETPISISTNLLLKKDAISGQKFRTRNLSMPSTSSPPCPEGTTQPNRSHGIDPSTPSPAPRRSLRDCRHHHSPQKQSHCCHQSPGPDRTRRLLDQDKIPNCLMLDA